MRQLSRLAWLALVVLPDTAPAQSYARAEQFLTWNLLRRVYHDQVAPNWFRDSSRFWYRVHTRGGFQFITVDPRAGTRAPLFDNGRLAAALARAAGTAVDPENLPFESVELDRDDSRAQAAILLGLGSAGYRCDIVAYRCDRRPPPGASARPVRSPDQRWDAYISGFNLWIRPAAGGDSIGLTADGVGNFGYGVRMPNATTIRRQLEERPALFWSRDSRRVAVFRYDERGVKRTAIVSLTPTRPVLYEYPYALPGDSTVPTADVHIVDLTTRSNRRVDYPPQPVSSRYGGGQASLYNFGDNPIVWGPRSERITFTHVDRGPKRVRWVEADAATGRARVVFVDSSATAVSSSVDMASASPNWSVLGSGDLILFSERDGFGHLYRVRPDGTLRHQITEGPWMVMSLLAVDEAAGRIYFTAAGREAGRHPDYRHLYAANLDGTGLVLLSPENADHAITPVPRGGFFIDSYSRIDQPPVTVLRATDGRVVRELERADVAELQEIGWRPGETFTAKARDGITALTGVIWKPSDFDSTKTYPVIDHIYPGPLFSPVDKAFFPTRDPGLSYATMGQAQALAELGFIVVEIDALGNAGRPKASREAWWGNLADNGIPDHVAVLKQLGARFRWLDLDRVGIYGYSGGGFASTGALLRNPEFYRVAVSIAGNHDTRSYNYGWGERFHGLVERDSSRGVDNYETVANSRLATRLEGHLLLIHGDLDDNVHPGHTIQLVDALIKANKSFDLLIVPDANHGLTQHPYVIRRTWDYFVRHLLGLEPPRDYRIIPP
jgi:dipeptidyl aminopeptidase/acylaminoacyl peptidase